MLYKSIKPTYVFLVIIAISAAVSCSRHPSPSIEVVPKTATAPVKDDADDPAVWIHPTDPSKSVIIGTDKGVKGGLYVWDLHGKQIQYVPLVRPNNVDVCYGMKLGERMVDIAVTDLRQPHNGIRIFQINPADGTLTDITTDNDIKTPEVIEPYGLCLYRRSADGAMFAIVSARRGQPATSLHQYRLLDDGSGKVKGVYVRAFGQGTIADKAEGLVADDELGFIYAADEGAAIRKYYADPDKGDNSEIVAFAQKDGINGDREGLAIYRCDSTTGYLLLSDQKGDSLSSVKVYRREGDKGNPRKHSLLFTINTIASGKTDGLEVTSYPVMPDFPHGFLVKHDSLRRNFKVYAWDDIIETYPIACSHKTASATRH